MKQYKLLKDYISPNGVRLKSGQILSTHWTDEKGDAILIEANGGSYAFWTYKDWLDKNTEEYTDI